MFPLLGAAYKAKEALHDIYCHSSKEDAMKAAEEWEQSLPAEVDHAFRVLKAALRSWWTEIFNYYDHPTSNAYTESINNLAKVMNRMERGYSFDVIRARLLFDDDARNDTRATLRKRVRREKPSVGYAFIGIRGFMEKEYEVVEEVQSVEYGPYIPILVRKLEAGDFA